VTEPKQINPERATEEAVLQYLHACDHPDWDALQRHASFSEKWVTFFLERHRPIPRDAFMTVYENKAWRKTYRVALRMMRCKSAPPAISMSLVPMFRWVDLMHSLRLPYLPGALKKRIVDDMMETIPRLALGEKIALARQSPRPLIKHLRMLGEPRVVRALLQNANFTYEDAMFMASYPRTKSPALSTLAASPRWKSFREVKLAILRHPNAPNHCQLPLLRTLTETELMTLSKDPKLKTYTRRLITRMRQELASKRARKGR